MIFGEKIDRGEQLDAEPGMADNYRDIRPDAISKTDAENFWKREMDISKRDSYSLSENELKNGITDCTEDQFEFDYTQSPDVKNSLAKFSEWNDMEPGDREKLCCELAKNIGENLGIDEAPMVIFYNGDEGQFGYYSEQTRCVYLNQNEMNDPQETARTIAHEVRHAYQHFKAEKMETVQDELYKYNFEHYIPVVYDDRGYVVNFLDYQGQMIEAEARAFEKLFEV